MSTWIEPRQWYQQLASFYAAAAALITSPDGNLLLLKDRHQDRWSFPGGYVEQNELPRQACERELREELGLDLTVGPLLVTDFASPAGHRPRSIISFTFDCGVLDLSTPLRLTSDENEDWAFLSPKDAMRYLPANVAPRVRAGLHARAHQTGIYLENGRRPGSTE